MGYNLNDFWKDNIENKVKDLDDLLSIFSDESNETFLRDFISRLCENNIERIFLDILSCPSLIVFPDNTGNMKVCGSLPEGWELTKKGMY